MSILPRERRLRHDRSVSGLLGGTLCGASGTSCAALDESTANGLLDAPSLSVLVPDARHAEVAGQMFSEAPELRSNILRDAAAAVLMREHGIRTIMTRDTDFHRFPILEVAVRFTELNYHGLSARPCRLRSRKSSSNREVRR